MASNTVDDYNKEFTDARTALESPIRGLTDRLLVSLSVPALEAIRRELADHNRRHGKIVVALNILGEFEVALEDLMNDGYPDMPTAEVSVAIFEELQAQRRDEEAADKKFAAVSPAVSMKVSLGTPVAKPLT